VTYLIVLVAEVSLGLSDATGMAVDAGEGRKGAAAI
jgi:hypothetical protein